MAVEGRCRCRAAIVKDVAIAGEDAPSPPVSRRGPPTRLHAGGHADAAVAWWLFIGLSGSGGCVQLGGSGVFG